METQVINATEYRNVSLSLLNVSKTNPRRIFEEAALKELAESIRVQGVLSPLLVRPLTENGFEIVFGERRYRAAQLAGQDTVPIRIKQMSDAEALEAQLVENLIRAEIHPMEEAQGFRALLDLEEPKYSIEQIAAKIGKSPVFVTARLKLTDLVPAAVEAFYADEIGVGHALLLAKLPADQQEHALSACFKEVYNGSQKPARILLPVRNLQFWIDSNILLVLKDAPFNKRDAQLVPTAGSCADCFKRTGHNKLLFGDDLGRQGDRLLRSGLLFGQAGRARKEDRRSQTETGTDHDRLWQTRRRQPDCSPQPVCRNPAGEAKEQIPAGRAGIQDMQVRHRGHRCGWHRKRRTPQGVRQSRLPGASPQEAAAAGRCRCSNEGRSRRSSGAKRPLLTPPAFAYSPPSPTPYLCG